MLIVSEEGTRAILRAPNPLPTPPPSTPLSLLHADAVQSLPDEFDWRSVGGVDLTSPIRSQFVPQWCGRCVRVPKVALTHTALQHAVLVVWP